MHVTYEITQRDVFESFVAHRDRTNFTKWRFRISAFLLLTLGLTGLLQVANSHAEMRLLLAPLFGLAAIWAIAMWAYPRMAAQIQFSKQPSIRGPRSMLADAAGVHLRWNGGSSDMEWKNFGGWLDGKNQFLIYRSPVSFDMVPKRGFTPEQLNEFRSLLAKNISVK